MTFIIYDIYPPQQARPVPYNIKWGGRVCALEASRGMETVQVASRAVPVPGPTAEQGVRAAMKDPGTRAAMADQGIRAAMAGSPPPPKKNDWGSPQQLWIITPNYEICV